MKEDIKREDLDKNILKTVIIKADFNGILNFYSALEKLKPILGEKFVNGQEIYMNSIDIQINKIEELSATISVPTPEIVKHPIYRPRAGNPEIFP